MVGLRAHLPPFIMALTKTDICNLALSEIGNERVQISDFDTDTDKIARQCRLHYQRSLDELIRMHTWNCCKGRDKLVPVDVSDDDNYFGWSFASPFPTGCIRPVYITNSDSVWRAVKDWTEWGVQGSEILTNYEDVWLQYIKEPAIADMDSLFLKAFYTLLASALAMPITGKREIKRELYDEFLNVIMPEARRVNSFEGYEQPMSDSEWLEATYTSPSQLSQSWPPFASGADYGSFNW
jgi:hypothetical protein